MNLCTFTFADLGITVQTSRFATENGVKEWHLMFHLDASSDDFPKQYLRLSTARSRVLDMPEFKGACGITTRYFLSDIANQQHLIPDLHTESTGIIQQPPLNGSKVAAWMYLQSPEGDISNHGATVQVVRNGYAHLWTSSMTSPHGDSAAQTTSILCSYEEMLADNQMSLADNCVRTWFYVRDVDTNYSGLVSARRENFEKQGLTAHTHYISSTGIGGSPYQNSAIVQMDAYAVKGLEDGQVRYLKALSHLNPTYEYGVTFERGTMISYGDRRHVFISGTASIDNRGKVLHTGDIVAQTKRMWENVEALLKEAESDFKDVMQIIVYLRDTADYNVVNEMFSQRFPDVPVVITLAPVCRPAWLIEMECVAVVENSNPKFRNF